MMDKRIQKDIHNPKLKFRGVTVTDIRFGDMFRQTRHQWPKSVMGFWHNTSVMMIFFKKKNWRRPLHIICMLKYKINMHTWFFLFFYVGTWFSIIRVKIRLYNRALLTIWNKVQHHITANTTNILILVQLNYSSCNLTNFYDSCIFTYKSLTIVTFHTRSDSSNRLTICFTWTHHLVRLARS